MAGEWASALGAAILGGNKAYEDRRDYDRNLAFRDREEKRRQDEAEARRKIEAVQLALSQRQLDQAPAQEARHQADAIYQRDPEGAYSDSNWIDLNRIAGTPIPINPNPVAARVGAIEQSPVKPVTPGTIRAGAALPEFGTTGAQLPKALVQQRQAREQELQRGDLQDQLLTAQTDKINTSDEDAVMKSRIDHGYRLDEIRLQNKGNLDAANVRAANSHLLSPNQKITQTRMLGDQWRKIKTAPTIIHSQVAVMEEGLRQSLAGNRAAGDQMVAVAFQKVLDPLSVVRESEYNRTPEGQALFARLQGQWERIQQGGMGVPISELSHFVEAARQVDHNAQLAIASEHQRIHDFAVGFDLDPNYVFSDPGPQDTPSGGNTQPGDVPKVPGSGGRGGGPSGDYQQYLNRRKQGQ